MTNKFGIPADKWDSIISLFNEYPQVHEILVFGSRAKDTAKPASDIDLCLMGTIDDSVKLKILNKYDELYLPWKLDLVIWEHINNNELKEHIQRVGKDARVKSSSKSS